MPTLIPKSNFSEITYLGEYAYWRTLRYVSVGNSNTPYLDEMLINVLTGEPFDLDKDSIREFIADDPELLAAYEQEKKKSVKSGST